MTYTPLPRPASRRALCWTALASLAALGAFAACGTDDPQPGSGGGGGAPTATGGRSSGGSPAASTGGQNPNGEGGAPAGVVDCVRPEAPSGDFSKRALLTAAADCAMWHYCRFEGTARSLHQEVQSYVADPGDETLEAAREAWREAMLTWSRAELFQFGPAGSRAHDAYYGRSFRDRIYSWPTTSRCRIEEQVAGLGYQNGFDQVLVPAKGLGALEYLLFYPGSDTACSATSATGQAWAGFSAEEIEQRKRDYTLALSADLTSLIQELRDTWAPDGNNFRQTFIDAEGYSNPGSDNDQEALNIVAWSLVYAEKEVKDWKIGPFTGKALPPAPVDDFEARYAQLSQELIVANLEGFQSLYQGCGEDGEGVGFDDWLVAANHADLAQDLDSALAGALAGTRDFPAFHEASEAQLASLYDDAIKPLTDLIKNDLMGGNGSPLNLRLPASAAGDND